MGQVTSDVHEKTNPPEMISTGFGSGILERKCDDGKEMKKHCVVHQDVWDSRCEVNE